MHAPMLAALLLWPLLLCSGRPAYHAPSPVRHCINLHILTEEARAFAGPPPPLPEDLRWAFTRCGTIPVSEFYVDDFRGGRGTRYSHSRRDLEQRVAGAARELAQPPLRRAAGAGARGAAASRAHLLGALQLPAVAALLQANASVVVFGSTAPDVEALLLAAGAARVLTVEYNALAYDHPAIVTATPAEVAAAWGGAGNSSSSSSSSGSSIPPPGSFDLAVSASSFDHDGLGRYGDPLAPDGDLLAMRGMARYLKPSGLALVSVPLGPDRLWWNLMRVYGKVRLPLLLQGWEVVARVGWRGGMELEEEAQGSAAGGGHPGVSHEPVHVLSRKAAAEAEL